MRAARGLVAVALALLGGQSRAEEIPVDRPVMVKITGGMVSAELEGGGMGAGKVLDVPSGFYVNEKGYEILERELTRCQLQEAAPAPEAAGLGLEPILWAVGIGFLTGAAVSAVVFLR